MTSSAALAVVLCLASAMAYAGAAVLQERVAHQPIGALVRAPLWWVAIGLNGAGAALHVVALRYGALSLVQPFGVLTLVLAVPFGAVVVRRAVTRVEWHGMAVVVCGLGGILVFMGAAGGIGVLGAGQLVGLLLVTAVVLTTLGGWSAVPGASGLWAAGAGGVAFGVSSALTQTVAVHVGDAGLGALSRPTVALAAVAVAVLSGAGLLFTQRSYRDGLAAPLAVSALANPVAAALIGLVLLGERVAGGSVGVAIVGFSALAAGIGVGLLAQAQVARDNRPLVPVEQPCPT
ncbi:hypothetical protein COUCH_36240 [Couchioplanes caeruleus]|uniref:hypothetical protein n=1 Tax=Couchioplanes caeruleus TaxID=56438 RepID=UPI0020C0EDE1|nr:hypothetical protein [Couchioplanes caeruleus]UQU64351.1 hypothetical protein COUCH_36240 [Couchioplanes caeruleus]